MPAISAYGQGWVAIDGQRVEQSVVVGARGVRQAWDCTRFEDLSAAHFAPLAELGAELIVFGSGARLRFVPPSWLVPLMHKRIGLETMDTAAACRTYNILAAEGRKVAAAILV